DVQEGKIYRAQAIAKDLLWGFASQDDRTLKKYTDRNSFVCPTESDYREVILQGLLLGCRVRDYEQRCGKVVEIGDLVMAISTYCRWLDGLKLRTKSGQIFLVRVKNVKKTEKCWTVSCYETSSPLPSDVIQGSLLEILFREEEKYWQTAVTGALFPFYTKKKTSTPAHPIENWPLLQCIYGDPSHLVLPGVARGDREIKLKNGEYMELNTRQAEALSRYNSPSMPSFVIEAPPGSGKTTTAAAMAVSYKGKGIQLILSTANVPVNNTALALAKFDLGTRSPIHLTSAEYEYKITEETRSPFTSLSLAKTREELRRKIEELEEQVEIAMSEEERKALKGEIYEACGPVLNEDHDIYIATLDTILKRVTKPNKDGSIHADAVKIRLKTQVERIIVEEASQFTEAALNALILNFPKAQIVLIGDSKQLPPFRYNENEIVSQLASRSALDVVKMKKNIPVIRLNEVYRASAPLCAPYSDAFYNGSLVSRKKMAVENPLGCLGKRTGGGRCLFWRVNKGVSYREWTSKVNEREITALAHIVSNLTKNGSGIDKKDVVVICYYEAQRRRAQANERLKGFEMLTVDSAQGREKRIVIVLTTRSSVPADANGSFFTSPKRINVAISRHQDALIVLGHPSIASAPNWTQVLAHKSFKHVEDNS
ncbi:hypothetical protein PMAYCL1PPCAC_07561, partial [Pristionchus mayeri]